MKKFLAILILILTFQTPTQADDIQDFQIEGMSIGDSLLDYFSEEEIKKGTNESVYEYIEDKTFVQTAFFKSEHVTSLNRQLEMFQKFGMDNLKTILLELSRDPAMIYWLDNNENINGEPNENYGRELLELFSMGVGNYTESDVKMAARAFTGWTFDQPLPLYPHGLYDATFKYKPDEHDRGIKTFLGEAGSSMRRSYLC